ncbi:hypothetical protein LOK49_LG02G02013 [Camellia lanceoleosa]|uniref:Uncharacterized protein n=1 Tax=Camellia lanceoleosa TaxID=1840588 RepID=A0ACC0IR99_9ERIC|nr:hypothetical protein LOK49_LG02G02013 [Camellia lanceoleosa]
MKKHASKTILPTFVRKLQSSPWSFWKTIYYQKWWPVVGDCPDVTGWLKGGSWPKACPRVAKACWMSQGD